MDSMQNGQKCPFTTQLMASCLQIPLSMERQSASSTLECELEVESDLPTYQRPDRNHNPNPDGSVDEIISENLSLARLNCIHSDLWFVGRPCPARPLHQYRIRELNIVVTEQMDMHLVWESHIIYLKPLPRYLLSPKLWESYLVCGDACHCSTQGQPEHMPDYSRTVNPKRRDCMRLQNRKVALGFVFSYACMITTETDFALAVEAGVIPRRDSEGLPTQWRRWREVARQILKNHSNTSVNPRFLHGELRLNRLNLVYLFRKWHPYQDHWINYRAFLRDNIAWVTVATVYMALALTALQVGLGTIDLRDNLSFHRAAYGFTLFSILGPITASAVILLTSSIHLARSTMSVIKETRGC
ncbi:hypothetical protein PG985_013145 [Apiospora marii]|uniref:uncharacterized protein n=1 Tax=Apiospora marii TaxID=335849 RepID=UPI00312E527F